MLAVFLLACGPRIKKEKKKKQRQIRRKGRGRRKERKGKADEGREIQRETKIGGKKDRLKERQADRQKD